MGSPLNATAKSTTANSYLTVAGANTILRRRLYTTKWDAASATPSADGYVVGTDADIGASTIAATEGTGTFTVGTIITFSGDDTEYTVSSALTAPGALSFAPALAVAVNAGTEITRQTANDREKALMWATQLFDSMMSWFGRKRTSEQSLWWPATGVVDENGNAYDYDTIPSILEVATAEMAQHLLTKDVFKVPAALGAGISEAQIGPLKAKITATQQLPVIPDNILSLLSTLGVLEPEAQKGSMIVPLKRV